MDNREQDIKDRMLMFAGNIDEFSIDQMVKDTDGALCRISAKTKNSIEVEIGKKKSKPSKSGEETYGINCKQWFTITDFNRRFKP